MVLRCFGRPGLRASWVVAFCFRWRCSVASVRFCFSSRRAVARFLWRFRAARRWWRSSSAPPRSVLARSVVPRFGLRWLARFPCVVAVFWRGRCAFASRLPSAVVRRSPGSFCFCGVRW